MRAAIFGRVKALYATLLSLTTVAAGCAGAPQAVDQEIEKTPAGMITVVEFVDYKCDFCQQMSAILEPLLDEQQGRVRVVIKHVPLAEHPGAKQAAAAAVCAESQGKLGPMHDALMKGAAVGDDDLLNLAQHAGLDVEAFKGCLRSDEPAARIARDTADYESLGGDGLPMVFIQKQKFVGLTDIDPLERALRDASP